MPTAIAPETGQCRVGCDHRLRSGVPDGDDGEADGELRQPEPSGQPDHGIDEEADPDPEPGDCRNENADLDSAFAAHHRVS